MAKEVRREIEACTSCGAEKSDSKCCDEMELGYFFEGVNYGALEEDEGDMLSLEELVELSATDSTFLRLRDATASLSTRLATQLELREHGANQWWLVSRRQAQATQEQSNLITPVRSFNMSLNYNASRNRYSIVRTGAWPDLYELLSFRHVMLDQNMPAAAFTAFESWIADHYDSDMLNDVMRTSIPVQQPVTVSADFAELSPSPYMDALPYQSAQLADMDAAIAELAASVANNTAMQMPDWAFVRAETEERSEDVSPEVEVEDDYAEEETDDEGYF